MIPPIRGKGFVWPLAAWTIPMMEKTNHTSARIPKMPEMISTAVELMSISRVVSTLDSTLLITDTRNRTSPWLVWYRANGSCLAVRRGIRTRIPKYARIAMPFFVWAWLGAAAWTGC